MRLSDFTFAFHDDAVSTPVDLALRVEEISLEDVAPQGPDDPLRMKVNALFSAPGVVERISLTGEVAPFTREKSLRFLLAAR